VPLHDVNRAVADGEDEGFVKVHVKKGTDKILGGTIVAAHAGEIISELTLAIVNKVGLGAIGKVIHPYPTQAEALKRASGLYTRTRLSPGLEKWFRRWLAWRR
jgi:pyruvate/2-oxoglutarate dehydrogenase complex dihydrolipoamide dehydrogenase (E3) component